MGGARRRSPRREGQGAARLRGRQNHPPVRPRRQELKEFPHPSSVTGLSFDGRGKRVAASHYNGATLWFVGAKVDSPASWMEGQPYRQSPFDPDGDAVVTAMQENALHGWALSDDQHMRMSGYPCEERSRCRSAGPASGCDQRRGRDGAVAVLRRRPMGKAPMELAGGDDVTCTRRRLPSTAGDGGGRFRRRSGGAGGGQLLPRPADRAARAGPVSALAWSAGREPARHRDGGRASRRWLMSKRRIPGAGDVARLRRWFDHLRFASFDSEYCKRAAHLPFDSRPNQPVAPTIPFDE